MCPVCGRGRVLSGQQQAAVRTALQHKVTILTGGPGTGKTTTLRALLDVLDQEGMTYALGAPTGRAAKRQAEATGSSSEDTPPPIGVSTGDGLWTTR